MGVLRLFRWIVKKFRKDIIVRIQKQGKRYIHLDKKIEYHRPQVLLIDCNAIFHPACREVYEPERPSVLNYQDESEEQNKCTECEQEYCNSCVDDIDKCSGCLRCPQLTCCGLQQMPCGAYEHGDCAYYHHKECRCER